jgi:hypothetical protein
MTTEPWFDIRLEVCYTGPMTDHHLLDDAETHREARRNACEWAHALLQHSKP